MVNLHRHLESCDKNPGHQKFIPVDQFNVEHLPSGYHDNDLVDLVRAISDLTVRVSVTYVSETRPETIPGSDKPFPCYSNRWRDMMRIGTGWVCEVKKYLNEDDTVKKTCDCKECLNSTTPKTQFAHFLINTVAHTVFDQLEGAHTTCHLFFDRGGTPDLCSGVVTLSGMSRVESDIETKCQMIYASHDMDLADKLDKMVVNCEHLMETVKSKYPLSDTQGLPPPAGHVDDIMPALAIIVSHPHGCSKQVSIGHCINEDKKADGLTMYKYTTATCPGSGGALVFVLGMDRWKKLNFGHAHSGNCDGNRELNYSGFSRNDLP